MIDKKTYLAYAAGGREFEVEQALNDAKFSVWCGKKVEFIRKGKNRRPEAEVFPKLPNYVFITLSDDDWHRLSEVKIKHLAKAMYCLRRDDELQLANFKAIVDSDFQAGQRIAAKNDPAMISQFTIGQALTDLRGRFGESALKFRRIVERGHQMHPVIEAEMEAMGQIVTVELDPLDVKPYKHL